MVGLLRQKNEKQIGDLRPSTKMVFLYKWDYAKEV
jgi:hypothetical protein